MGWNDLIGRRIGPYEIIEELGRGGTARVYRAYQESPQRYVAIKVLLNDAEDRLGFVRRFERELEVVAQLNHPNIVAVYESGELEDLVYLVMQVVNGGTFRQRLGQPLSVSEACSAVIQVARALQHAHARGIVHRDVKPSNMLIDTDHDGRILLTDFGIAKLAGMRGLTKSGTTIGTPEYMAPEQAEGREIDARADVYSLGCVLYEALAGRAPFVGASPVSVLYQQVHIKPDYIRVHNAEIPRELARIVDLALAKQPEQRFSSADSFAWALHPFTIMRDRGTASGPISGWTPLLDGVAGGLDLRTGPRKDAAGQASAFAGPPTSAEPSGALGSGSGAESGLGTEGLDALFPDDPEARPARGERASSSPAHALVSAPDGYLPGSSLVTEMPGPAVGFGGEPDVGSSGPRPTIPLVAMPLPSRAPESQSLDLPLTPEGQLDMRALMTQVEPASPEDVESRDWTPPADLPPYEQWSSSEEVSPYTAWTAAPLATPYATWEEMAEYPPYEPELGEVPSIWGDMHTPGFAQQSDAVTPPPIWRPEELESPAARPRGRARVRPARGAVVGAVIAAVLVLALISWAAVSALGIGVASGLPRTPTVGATSHPTATPLPTATATAAATATPTEQQLLDHQAAADFRGVVVATSQVNACAGGGSTSVFGRADAIWVSLCLTQAAPSGPLSVVVEHGQSVVTVVARTTAYPGHSYAWAYYASNLAPGSYHVVVSFSGGTAADIPLSVQ